MELHDVEKELNELKVEIIHDSDLHKEVKNKMVLSVEVDIDTDIDYSKIYDANYNLKKHTGRKDNMYITFGSTRPGTFTFAATQVIPQDQLEASMVSHEEWNKMSRKVGTTFPDLCWYHAEGTNHKTKEESLTKFREGSQLGDLTWFLPSRFADNFIEIMHTLNQSLLLGLMQESIIYGPEYELVK